MNMEKEKKRKEKRRKKKDRIMVWEKSVKKLRNIASKSKVKRNDKQRLREKK